MDNYQITFTLSETIAIIAALITLLSALYARWSWKQAKRSNEINTLQHKIDIYDAYHSLKMYMTQKAEFAEIEEVTKFYYPLRSAEYYLPKIYSNIKIFQESCLAVARINRKNKGFTDKSIEECKPYFEAIEKAQKKIEKFKEKTIKEADV